MRNSMTHQRRFTKEFEEEAVGLAQTSGRRGRLRLARSRSRRARSRNPACQPREHCAMTGWFALPLIVGAVITVAAMFRAARRLAPRPGMPRRSKPRTIRFKDVADAQGPMFDASANAPRASPLTDLGGFVW